MSLLQNKNRPTDIVYKLVVIKEDRLGRRDKLGVWGYVYTTIY